MRWWSVLLLLVGLARAGGQASAPLLMPAGLAYDTQGNLYFSDAGQQVIRKLNPGGVLTVFAGSGVEGYAGDGGLATAARLDMPGAIAMDPAGDVFVCDTHNHRIRRVDAASGVISTVVGTGVAGLSADGLSALSSTLDQPTALAVDGAGNLFYADGRRNVVRRVDHGTGLLRTVAGNGVQGSAGDGGPALSASLDAPAGLAVDATGNIFISDSHNQRVRRVDASSGAITTVGAATLRLPRVLAFDAAGNLYIVDSGNHRLRRVDVSTGQVVSIAGAGTEAFAGDGGPAVGAELDSPRAVAISPSGLATMTDTGNARVRQVDAAGVISTIVGAGALAPAGLTLSGPAAVTYGNGTLTAQLGGAAGTGTVILFDGATVIASTGLIGNTAAFSTTSLAAGMHSLVATFAGDAAHGPLRSNTLPLAITAAPATAIPTGVLTVYGLSIPALSGTVAGLLAQDAGLVQVTYQSAAQASSPAGTYPISAVLSGPAAGNYTLTTVPATVMIGKASSSVSLSLGLLAHVSSGTAGQPGGAVTLFDGSVANATVNATASGDAQFSPSSLSNGSHTLSASYPGDTNFFASQSPPVVVTIAPAAAADFAFVASGTSAVTVVAGSDAAYSFAATAVNGALSSPIEFAVSGLPSGATASFSPSLLPAGALPATITMTVHTLKTASLEWLGKLTVAMMFGLLSLPRKRARRLIACLLLCGLAGCGDRVFTGAQSGPVSRSYNLTVNATATSNSGTVLLHGVPVTLTLQ